MENISTTWDAQKWFDIYLDKINLGAMCSIFFRQHQYH